MNWTRIFFAVLALAVVTPGLAHAQTSDDPLQKLVGDYVLVESDKAVERRDASIDKVVDELNFFIRGIARSRLQDGNPIPKRLSIRKEGSKMTIGFDGDAWTAIVGGKAVEGEGTSGDPLKMTLRKRGSQLAQRFMGEEGGKENVFRSTEDGVVVSVRIFSERLPSDVFYQLKFRRK